jgi:arginase family enzyme
MIIVQVPGIHGLGKTRGCEDSPCMIERDLRKKKLKYSVVEFSLDNSNVQEMQKIIFSGAIKIFRDSKDSGEKIIFLGGDHSISYPIANAFRQVYNSFLFVMDAHVDLMQAMEEPSHEEWLRALIEEGFEPENLVIVGARKIFKEERDFFEKNKIKIIKKGEISSFLKNEEKWKALEEFEGVYLSLDVDVLDPEFINATGYLEKNGLDVEQVKSFLKRIFDLRNFVAMDLVELNVGKDLNNKSLKLVSEMIGDLVKKEQE